MPSYLAFDLGASSGRAMLATLEEGRVSLRELHRFHTPLAERDGHLQWDVGALWSEVERGLELALAAAPALRSVSVDSWGVDYVPLDDAGRPLRDPYCYRDPRTHGRAARLFERVTADELYRRTGIQLLEINTLFQLLADVDEEPELAGRAAARLSIADYLNFRLSGRAAAERTMASTTQLMDVRTGEWARDLIARLGLPGGGWPEIVAPGTVLGPLVEGLGGVDGGPVVVAGCSHDTGAAVAAVPADAAGPPWAYLATGTWALLGVERSEPLLTEEARAANFTNEAGLDGTVRFLKNLMGMWILQECEREWRAAGEPVDYPALLAQAAAAPAPGALLEVDDARFAAPGGMIGKLELYCREGGMRVPESRGELVRLILESLAARWAAALGELERLTGEPAEVVHLVGGASRNELLCQLVADASGRAVLAGPVEATALGNALVQARALGDLPAGRSIREVVRAGERVTRYEPRPTKRHEPVAPLPIARER